MAKILYFDCFAGASGDMVLGALLDAGLPLAELEAALGSLLIPGYSLSAERVLRGGVSATKFRLQEGPAAGSRAVHAEPPAGPGPEPARQHPKARGDERGRRHGHDEAHSHGGAGAHRHAHDDVHEDALGTAAETGASSQPHPHHGHRSLAEITGLIERSSLSARGRARAIELFRRLAEAEAAIHQMPVDKVHLHEVGALDSIIDIVGAVFGLEWMGADRVIASPMNVGGGVVRSAHGVFPVPAPATLRLLGDAPVYSSGIQLETLTPTGALLVTGYASAYGPVPPMRVERVGYTPKVFRLVVGRDDEAPGVQRVTVLECEIDDMNPQIYGVLLDALYAAGALEVYYTPVQMKKNRPGTLLTVVAPPERRERLTQLVFRETTTIGLRYQELMRACLDRELVEVETAVGRVRVKIARQGAEVLNASPEFDDCARLAAERGLPVKQVHALAIQAYWQSRQRK
jgi:uncharacterized protein (TIGR00299 family) protein